MKKTFTLLALLCLVLTANAQAVTNRTSAGSPMTYAEFLTLSGTGKHFAIVGASSNTNFCYPNWFGFTATFVGTLTTTYLFDLEPSATGTGWYNIKRVSDNLYVSAEGGQFNASTKLDFRPVNRRSDDYAAEFSDENLHISLDNAAGNHYNLNTSNLGFRGGTGGYSTYIAYGPFNVVTVNYVDDNNTPLQSAETMIVKEGATITAPSFAGYNVDKTSETISADGTVTFTYTATSSYDYTIVVNGAVAGMTMTIKGDEISYGSSSYSTDAAVVESDVVVTFPAEYSYLTANVTISGTTITVDCEDTRWPINFSKTQTYIRTERFITNVRIGSKTFPITNDGLNTLAYRDFTSDVLVVPAGATLVPAIGYQGQWMHGFFYVDLDNDGTFYVENPDHQTSANTEYNGELLSYANQGNALNSSHQEMPAFTMPTTPGDYRARFKLDWASTDPGGNPGADVNDVTSQNHIIANGGTIVDITLRIAAPADVTYVVVDKSNNELFRATESMAVGDVITTLPEAYQRSVFYTYDEKNETVTGDMEVTFTATKRADAPIVYTADATAPVWNFLRIRPTDSRAAYVRYDAAATPNVNLVTENPADPTAMWAFVGNPYDGFQMINKEAGTAVVLGSAIADASDSNGGTTYCSLAAPGSQTCETWFVTASSYATNTNGFFIYNSEGQYFNQRSATSNLTYWTGGHDLGSTFVAITPEEVYDALLTQLEDYSYGTGLNQYGLVVESIDRTTQAATIISGLKAAGYSETNLAVAKAALDGTSLNMPTGKFIKLYNAARNAWIGAAETGQHPNASTEEEAGIYYVADDGQIVSYAYGKALQNAAGAPCVASAGTDGGTFTISDAGSGTYYFYCGGYLVAWDTSSNRNSSPDDYAKFTLTEVTELPVSISAAGQATLSLPVAWEVPDGVTVRYATREHDGLLTIEDAAETAIAAGEAVILVGAEGTYNVAVATTGTALNSLLTATTPKGVSVETSTKAYILAQQGDNVGFALLADSDRNIAGFKAYYVSTAAGDAPQFLFFDEGDVTGINSVNAAAQNGAAVYDLQGRRVNGALKGVYIVNGKKVLF